MFGVLFIWAALEGISRTRLGLDSLSLAIFKQEPNPLKIYHTYFFVIFSCIGFFSQVRISSLKSIIEIKKRGR
jgi:hypothetical protein